MRIYVATSFLNRNEARRVMVLLRAAGHSITHDWTYEDPYGRVGPELQRYFGECAATDVAAVVAADALLVLHHERGRGMLVELGIALADPAKPILVVGAPPFAPIFYALPRVRHFPAIGPALQALGEVP